MTASIPAARNSAENARHELRMIRSWAPIIALGIAVGLFAIHAIVFGPTMWAAAERLRAEQIDQENRLFCDKLGMNLSAEAFATCASLLADIRRRQTNRLSAEAGWQ